MTRRALLSLVTAALDPKPALEKLAAAARDGKPAAAVLHVQQGAKVETHHFGTATLESRFLIASINKPMTVAAFLWAARKHKLDLNQPVKSYLPEFQHNVTLKQLLTHTSGLPDMLPDNTALRKRNAPLSEYTRLALTTPLLFAPGTKWSYSSTGILLASEIAHRVDSRPFNTILEQEIFKPLGMKSTVPGLGKLTLNDVVRSQTEFAPQDLGASADAKNWDWNSQYWRSLGAPWGGAHSTAADIARFLRSFLHPTGKPLYKDDATAMITNQNAPGINPYGYGFSLGPRLDPNLPAAAFGHGGSTGTLCWADPTRDLSFVLLTSLPDNVARKAIIQPVSNIISASH